MKTTSRILILFVLGAAGACGGSSQPELPNRGEVPHKNVQEVDPTSTSFSPKAGQTIYIPVYSSVSISDRPHLFNLAINLTFRNTDPKASVFLTSARYYDGDGNLLRNYASKPLRVGPMATADIYVRESDKAGGKSASFVVEWISDSEVSNALAESVMVGTANNQGVSFTLPGHVLRDLRQP